MPSYLSRYIEHGIGGNHREIVHFVAEQEIFSLFSASGPTPSTTQPGTLRGLNNQCLKLIIFCANVELAWSYIYIYIYICVCVCVYVRAYAHTFHARKPFIFYGTVHNMFSKLKTGDALFYRTIYDLVLLTYTFLYISLHTGDIILFS